MCDRIRRVPLDEWTVEMTPDDTRRVRNNTPGHVDSPPLLCPLSHAVVSSQSAIAFSTPALYSDGSKKLRLGLNE